MFGRRRKRGRHSVGEGTAQPEAATSSRSSRDLSTDRSTSPRRPTTALQRLDLGSVRLPVPDGAQLQVEMDPAGAVRAVHLLTPVGQLTVSAFAAPKSGGLWQEVGAELITQLKEDGARIGRENGEWGEEITARNSGVAAAVRRRRRPAVDAARRRCRSARSTPRPPRRRCTTLVRGTVVVRGEQPMPRAHPVADRAARGDRPAHRPSPTGLTHAPVLSRVSPATGQPGEHRGAAQGGAARAEGRERRRAQSRVGECACPRSSDVHRMNRVVRARGDARWHGQPPQLRSSRRTDRGGLAQARRETGPVAAPGPVAARRASHPSTPGQRAVDARPLDHRPRWPTPRERPVPPSGAPCQAGSASSSPAHRSGWRTAHERREVRAQ